MHPPSEQQRIREQKVQKLRQQGIDPYPAASFFTSATAVEIKKAQEADLLAEMGEHTLAGRLVARRIMGKTVFAELQDHTGKIQLYVARDTLCPGEDKRLFTEIFKKYIDLGDIVGVKGTPFITKVGTLALRVTHLQLLTKATKPLPIVKETREEGTTKRYYTFSNPEQRYRQRYLDLILNPEVRERFVQRTQIIRHLRNLLDQEGYLEVETPILQPLYGGAAARPFTTHHNTLGESLFLRISDELYLKRLIVGGYPGVYEIGKDFRNEGMSRFHNPEFTMLEVYIPYRDYRWGMDRVEQWISALVMNVHGQHQCTVGAHTIDFTPPWKRFTLFGAILHFTGKDIAQMQGDDLRKVAEQLEVHVEENASDSKIIDNIFSQCCEPHLIQPTFITDYPRAMSPLAKSHHDNPDMVERFELICGGKELCNAYSELNDPIEQRKRLVAQHQIHAQGDEEAMVLDEDYINALNYGMPPTVGIGIGIDRLVMMLTNAASIQEVLFFPQLRKNKRSSEKQPTGQNP